MLVQSYNAYRQNISNTTLTKSHNKFSFGMVKSAKNLSELYAMIPDRTVETVFVDFNIPNIDVSEIVRNWYSKGGNKFGGTIYQNGGRGFFDEFHASHLSENSCIDRQNFLNHVRKFINRTPSEINILDAGCGEGKELKDFKALGYNVFGFDASSDCVVMAEKNTGIPIVQATFNDYQSSQSFDAIFTRKALQHVAKSGFQDALQNLVNHLKPEGFLFAVTKLDNHPINGVGRQLFNKNRLFHNFLTEREIIGYSSNLHGAKLVYMETSSNPNVYDKTDTANVTFVLKNCRE